MTLAVGGTLNNIKIFITLMVFLKEFFEKVNIEKNLHTTKKRAKLLGFQKVRVSIVHNHSLIKNTFLNFVCWG